MEPIVPSRGERIGKSEGAVRNSAPKPRPEKAPSSSSGIATKAILALLLIVCVGLGYWGFQQHQQIASLKLQFDDLQAKIDTTDESMSQSGAVLSIRIQEHGKLLAAQDTQLKEHFSEIDKLWMARNKNKKAVDDSVKSVASLKSGLTANKKSINQILSDVKKVKISQLGSQAEIAELADQLDSVLVQIDRFEGNIKQWQVKTNARISDTEQAVKAIDAFRHSVNQQLLKLRTQPARSRTLNQE